MSEDRLLDVVDGLYEAALKPENWPAALDGIVEALNGVAYAHFLMDKKTLKVPVTFYTGFSEQFAREYRNFYSTIDPGAAYIAANPNLSIYQDHLWIEEAAIDRSEFYDWFEVNGGVRYRVAGVVANTNRYFGVTAMQTTERQGPPNEDQQRLFLKLLPHIRRATRLSQEFAARLDERRSWSDVLDCVQRGVMLLDRSGRAIFVNRGAQEILNQRDGLSLDRGDRLRAQKWSDSIELFELIERATLTAKSPDLYTGGARSVARPSGRRNYVVLVSPLRTTVLDAIGESHPVTVVFISDPDAVVEVPEDTLRRIFGLTCGETRLALALLREDTLKEAANSLQITEGSSRQVLKRIFQKTGCYGQAALIRLLLSLTDVTPSSASYETCLSPEEGLRDGRF